MLSEGGSRVENEGKKGELLSVGIFPHISSNPTWNSTSLTPATMSDYPMQDPYAQGPPPTGPRAGAKYEERPRSPPLVYSLPLTPLS